MTAYPWLKLWNEAPTDPKWLAVADMAGSSPSLAWHTFSAALAYANEQPNRGSIVGFDLRVIAAFCRVGVDEVRRVMQALREFGMLIGEHIAKWTKRQTEKLERPRTANAERVARHRATTSEEARQSDLFINRISITDRGDPAIVPRTANAARQARWRERRREAGLPTLLTNGQIVRKSILKRDQFMCQYCGSTDGPFHCDHKLPRSRGGTDADDNLITSCAACNVSKGRFTIEEWISSGLAPERVTHMVGVTSITQGVSSAAEEEEGYAFQRKIPESVSDSESVAACEGSDENEVDSFGRVAPLGAASAGAERAETDGDPLQIAGPARSGAASSVVQFADGVGPKLKAQKKELRRQKVLRFIKATYGDDECRARFMGMMGADTVRDEQWWFDKCDAEMRLAGWDDVRDSRLRTGGRSGG